MISLKFDNIVKHEENLKKLQSVKNTERDKSSIDGLLSEDECKIAGVLSAFGDKTAKELELDSTIIFITNLYAKNNWGEMKEDIIANVHEIKPLFTVPEIEITFDRLDKQKMLRKK